MNISKVHSCQQQELVALGKAEPPAKFCRCRKTMDYQEADELVKCGEALWVVVARERGKESVRCDMCNGSTEVKNCAKCNGTKMVEVARTWDTYKYDIVLVRHRSKNVSTPKVPTIESEHIEYAYVNQDPKAAARIEEYGLLTLEARAYPGPSRCTHRKEFKCTRCEVPTGTKVYAISVEPADNPETGEGRNYDFGRAI